MNIVKRIVWAMCLLYTINIIISTTGNILPINIYTIALVAILDIPGILGLIILKYYI